MKTKGFTLVELLVVIAIISMLMGILMPALAKARIIAQRVVCGAHLRGAGSALMLYANENNGKYVRAGGMQSKWGPTKKWNAAGTPALKPEEEAFGLYPNNLATIGANFYYLIKYADAPAKLFLCPADGAAREFKLSDPEYRGTVPNNDTTAPWDFGTAPQKHYSYAYHSPFSGVLMGTISPAPNAPAGNRAYQMPLAAQGPEAYFPLNAAGDPGMAVMADRNPYIALAYDNTWDSYVWRNLPAASKETERWGNSPNHKGDGQNVLFNDSSVVFVTVPYCGVNEDNIYSLAVPGRAVQVGVEPWDVFGPNVVPQSRTDSVLINEGLKQGKIALSGKP